MFLPLFFLVSVPPISITSTDNQSTRSTTVITPHLYQTISPPSYPTQSSDGQQAIKTTKEVGVEEISTTQQPSVMRHWSCDQ